MFDPQSPREVMEALVHAQGIAAGPGAADSRLKLAQDSLKPQGARGETRYRVSMEMEVSNHCPECGTNIGGTRIEKQFARTVWAPNEEEAGERAMELLMDHGPDYLGVTEVTLVSESVAPC